MVQSLDDLEFLIADDPDAKQTGARLWAEIQLAAAQDSAED